MVSVLVCVMNALKIVILHYCLIHLFAGQKINMGVWLGLLKFNSCNIFVLFGN